MTHQAREGMTYEERCAHEGAEGWSQDLKDRLDRFSKAQLHRDCKRLTSAVTDAPPSVCAATDCCIEIHGRGTCATCGRTADPTDAAT